MFSLKFSEFISEVDVAYFMGIIENVLPFARLIENRSVSHLCPSCVNQPENQVQK